MNKYSQMRSIHNGLGVAEFVNFSTRENFQSYGSDFSNSLHQVVQWERRGGGGGDLVVAFCKI